MHRLIRRQIRRHLGIDPSDVPEELRSFLEAVDAAYTEADSDRRLVERSLELTSRELLQRNQDLSRDIERRREAEAALRLSESRLKAILGALPDRLFVLNRDGSFAERYVGQDFAGDADADDPQSGRRPSADPLGAHVAETASQYLRDALETGAPQRWESRVEVGGRTLHLEVRLIAIGEDHALAIVRDDTETHEMQERLLISDRMASVGTLAAGVAHEINNPLTYVIANLGHAAEELERLDREHRFSLASDVLSALSDAWNGANRVRRIVRDLKTFSRMEREEVGPVDLHDVIDSTSGMAAPEFRHRARLIKEYGQIPMVRGNASRLGQVFLNLIVNAAQALPVGRADCHSIAVRTYRGAKDDVLIDISDTGPGMTEDVLRRVFDPFFTTKPVGVGTGLGLSICHNIVRSLGGGISVRSVVGEGTTFTVRLPATQDQPRVRSARPVRSEDTTRRRILVVDDEPGVGRAVRRVLRKHEVLSVRSGSEGLEILSQDQSFDLVLCDLMMPNVSGMDLYESVEASHPELAGKFVFITGGAFADAARDFIQQPGRKVLEKPFAAPELLALVSALQRERRSLAPPAAITQPPGSSDAPRSAAGGM